MGNDLFRLAFGEPPSPESLPTVAGEGFWRTKGCEYMSTVISEFVDNLRLCAENGRALEMSACDTRELALALADYDFDENRRITREAVENIIENAVNNAVFSLDSQITDECIQRIFGDRSRVQR